MSFLKELHLLFAEIERTAKADPQFAERLQATLKRPTTRPNVTPSPKRTNRRAPSAIDPFQEYRKGSTVLRDSLNNLDLERLRDVVAQYGMDRAKLAMKWKDKNRLIDLIIDTVAHRAEKGNAFRGVEAEARPTNATLGTPNETTNP